ncbi:uncharacterized protein TNCV_2239701 [Trichonephila clavipes]|nr:uncharacterized protein TNCV_2239701 [Trichonephila clavipes]
MWTKREKETTKLEKLIAVENFSASKNLSKKITGIAIDNLSSDELRFTLGVHDGRIRVRRYAGERCLPEGVIERHSGLTPVVMVWGAISYHGRSNLLRIEGLPSEVEENCDLIVLDDMMNDVTSEISQMFTMGSHHKKYSIILITQYLFPRAKSMRDISLNAHYIILFRNNRDVSQAACFGRQAFPGCGKFFMDSYKKATEEPFSYLLVDVHPRSPEVQRLLVASPAQRKAILKSATDDQIKTLCEICENLLSGNIPTKKTKNLCSYKRVIRLLANRSVPISRKRKLFTTNRQFGAFFPLILPGVLSLLGGIAGKAISKRI